MGKYQTIGGAIFQIGTVCTEANFSPYGDVGDGDIGKNNSTTQFQQIFTCTGFDMYKMQGIPAEGTLPMVTWLTPLGSSKNLTPLDISHRH